MLVKIFINISMDHNIYTLNDYKKLINIKSIRKIINVMVGTTKMYVSLSTKKT